MNLSNVSMSQAIFSSMLSAAKIEIMAMAENIFNRKTKVLQERINELEGVVGKLAEDVYNMKWQVL